MSKLPAIFNNLRLPVVAAPLFIISTPDLVIAQCKAGVVGSFPALNAREQDGEPRRPCRPLCGEPDCASIQCAS
jgi:NAD(P)H-dependent flavin oxidoreductase YrpB (nitropropane dioxygenase family)